MKLMGFVELSMIVRAVLQSELLDFKELTIPIVTSKPPGTIEME